ncbi:DUF6153 family protein [Streptomyces prasinosporus]|uniref:DUF6153 family protein n=1 Tax=Streptomyces prasinosporus TaxID=68256 RepID=A0ABP6TM78_9ACTN
MLGLLVGLFGMHSLAPGGTTAATGHHSAAHSSAAHHADPVVLTAESVCHGDGDGRGHAEHADATCSSGAVSAGPVLPAPTLDPTGQTAELAGSHLSMAAEPEGGRAPPSLAELQLLRI